MRGLLHLQNPEDPSNSDGMDLYVISVVILLATQ